MASKSVGAGKGKTVIKSGLSDEEKKRIIGLHNELRQKVAKGLETRGKPGPQPAAKSMPDVKWDDELAAMAQKWADQCSLAHDTNRKVERFPVGQNIAISGTTSEPDTLKVDNMVLGWYNEVEHHPKCNVNKFGAASATKSGHYTQLVWAKSTLIGCGGIKFKEGGFNKFYLVCNYGPAGNVVGQPIYEVVEGTMKC